VTTPDPVAAERLRCQRIALALVAELERLRAETLDHAVAVAYRTARELTRAAARKVEAGEGKSG
jgi:hypothetical protein